jgi:hypothetical protein
MPIVHISGMIIPIVHISGMIPVSIILLNSFKYNGIHKLIVDLMSDTNDNLANDTLNGKIIEEEITSIIQNLKNGKAPGYDCVINEYIPPLHY